MKNDKVSLVLGFKITQGVYCKLKDFHKEMLRVDSSFYTGELLKFYQEGSISCGKQDLQFFVDKNYMSYTIKQVCDYIVKLYSQYGKKYDDRFFLAIKRILDILYKEFTGNDIIYIN